MSCRWTSFIFHSKKCFKKKYGKSKVYYLIECQNQNNNHTKHSVFDGRVRWKWLVFERISLCSPYYMFIYRNMGHKQVLAYELNFIFKIQSLCLHLTFEFIIESRITSSTFWMNDRTESKAVVAVYSIEMTSEWIPICGLFSSR